MTDSDFEIVRGGRGGGGIGGRGACGLLSSRRFSTLFEGYCQLRVTRNSKLSEIIS